MGTFDLDLDQSIAVGVMAGVAAVIYLILIYLSFVNLKDVRKR